jgi:hypothetical protein
MRLDRLLIRSAAVLALTAASLLCPAQEKMTGSSTQDNGLADSVKQLQEQVNELRSVVSDLRTESEHYRSETLALREELRSAMARVPTPAQAVETTIAGQSGDEKNQEGTNVSDTEGRLAKLEDAYGLLTGKVDDQYQTKVESGSKYRVRLSGMVLLNLFTNRGAVSNADLADWAGEPDAVGRANSTGFSLRQSQIGLEVFGPTIAGARTRGDVQVDFAGGFPRTSNGVVAGLMRLRTGTIRFDWAHTSVIAGQDSPFFSALSPTSFATVAEPALAYAGNLWTWIPQVRVEHRVTLTENSALTFQGGILDGLTGEPPLYSYGRTPQAGEYSRQPGYAGRVAWSHDFFGQPFTLGAGAYSSRQNWGFGRDVNAWASTLDWTAPLGKWLNLSGEFYRGQALGGLGGGLDQSAIFSGDPMSPSTQVRGLDAIGGWAQLKLRASSKVEINTAAGQDNPFASEIRAFPFSAYGVVQGTSIVRNQSELLNVIYRPRSDLLLSAEYRHITTHEIDNSRYSADHVNLVLGILF